MKSNDSGKILSQKDQEALVKEEIQRFVRMFKEKGSLTIDEINENLPPEIVLAPVLDQLMSALEVNGVTITDHLEKDKDEEKDSFLADPDKEEEEEEAEEEDPKGNDPVRLYLRKMGSVSLLTREGEVEIARRIEKGEREIVRAILMSPIGTVEIVNLGKRLDEGRIKVKSIFRGLEDEETQYDEKEYIDKIHELIGKVNEYKEKVAQNFVALRDEKLAGASKEKVLKEVRSQNELLMAEFENINFNRKTINRVVIKFRNLLNRLNVLKRRIKDGIEKTFSKDLQSLVDRARVVESNEKELQKMVRETGLSFGRFTSYARVAE
ncbi:MAG: sigma-70 factor domain-containing protein, partial [Bdellovibrio sp.]